MRGNCPFYGRYMALMVTPGVDTAKPGVVAGLRGFLLIGTGGNQCGAIATAHAACYMDVEGLGPDWKTCRVVRGISPTPESIGDAVERAIGGKPTLPGEVQ